jgi:hypothetical protein
VLAAGALDAGYCFDRGLLRPSLAHGKDVHTVQGGLPYSTAGRSPQRTASVLIWPMLPAGLALILEVAAGG